MTESESGGRRKSSGVTGSNPGLMLNRSRVSRKRESKKDETGRSNNSNIAQGRNSTGLTFVVENSEESIIIQHIEDLDDSKERKAKHKALKPISKKHPEYELAYDMMLGIRTVVGRIEAGHSELEDSFSMASTEDGVHEADSLVQRFGNDFVGRVAPKKFLEKKRYRFPKNGGTYTPSHLMSSFKFKDYCPQIFKMLRQLFNIDPSDYQTEVCGNYLYLEFMTNSKSGQFFFYSHSQRFMVKTMTKTEAKLLRKIMPQYYSYIRKHPHSLLTKFFGMHRVKPHRREHIYFLIMGSVFYSKEGLEIHEQYDLKGSTKGRKAGPNENMKKDLDLLENKVFLKVGRDKAKLFRQQLLLDTEFLRKNQIMDYSLLVGIHHRDRGLRPSVIPKRITPMQDDRKEALPELFTVDSSSRMSKKRAITTPLGNKAIDVPHEHHSKSRVRATTTTDDSGRVIHSVRRSSMDPRHKRHYKLSTPLVDQFIVPEIIPDNELDKLPENAEINNTNYTPNIRGQVYSGMESDDEINEFAQNENPFTDTCGGMCYRNPNTGELGNEIYFTGVIDLLQQFNRRKKVESFLKTRMNNPEVISAVDPEFYSRRFNRFIEEKIM